MVRNRNLLPRLIGFGLLCTVFFSITGLQLLATNTGNPLPAVFNKINLIDTLPFPIHERKGDIISDNKKSTFDFKTPPNITDSVAYDFRTRLYTVYQKIGSKYYRTPTTYTSEEYWALRGRQAENDILKSGQIP